MDGLELAERREKVKEALESLPEHLRLTIILAYYQGLKYKDIADIMKIPVGTVKSRLHAAMQKLQEALLSTEAAQLQPGRYHETRSSRLPDERGRT